MGAVLTSTMYLQDKTAGCVCASVCVHVHVHAHKFMCVYVCNENEIPCCEHHYNIGVLRVGNTLHEEWPTNITTKPGYGSQPEQYTPPDNTIAHIKRQSTTGETPTSLSHPVVIAVKMVLTRPKMRHSIMLSAL